MARNRQRASERKRRDEDPNPIHRENVPGPVEHLGDVDEFEAALVAGADGEPETDPDAAERAALGGDGDGDGGQPPAGGALTTARADAPAPGSGPSRFLAFLRACWAELQRVQWPDRRQVGQATAVVLGFVIIAGAFLGLADAVAERIVDLII